MRHLLTALYKGPIFRFIGIIVGAICFMLLTSILLTPLIAQTKITSEFVFSSDIDSTQSVAWGDVDGDGDLDLAVGNSGTPNKLYINEKGVLSSTATWVSEESDPTTSVAWGDVDGDGDLDLAVGNFSTFDQTCQCYRDNGHNKLYLNNGGVLDTNPVWISDDNDLTTDIAWGDVDGDGRFDLAVGNFIGKNKVYLNEGENLQTTAAWTALISDSTWSVAWGDVDVDGDLDLAFGNFPTHDDNCSCFLNDGDNKLYLNMTGTLQITPIWSSNDNDLTRDISWADVDGDGYLELTAGNWAYETNAGANKIYANENGTLSSLLTSTWVSNDNDGTYAVIWGDIDNDGDLDLAAGNREGPSRIYLNSEAGLSRDADLVFAINNGTNDIAWGDADGDNHLDLAIANSGEPNRLYINTNLGLQAKADWTSANNTPTRGLAWGDIDRDGDLDLVFGNDGTPNTLYVNEDGNLRLSTDWAPDAHNTYWVAWGDMNGDGYLDLAVANTRQPVKLYLNDNGVLRSTPSWTSSNESDGSFALAWGDVDNDGDLDLAVANAGNPNRLYMNDKGVLEALPAWSSAYSDTTRSLVWGDIDSDGDLDLVVGNWRQPNKIYFNEGGILQIQAGWQSDDSSHSNSIALADIDNDGDLDLVDGTNGVNQIYFNDGELQTSAGWFSAESTTTRGLALGDIDGDGDIDIISGNDGGPINLYINDKGTMKTVSAWSSNDTNIAYKVALGDIDSDGDLDLAAAYLGTSNKLYVNQKPAHPLYFTQTSHIALDLNSNQVPTFNQPSIQLASANFYAVPGIRASGEVPFTYTLFNPTNILPRQIRAFYSIDGGGSWLPAKPTPDTITQNLTLNPLLPVALSNTHVFTWDVNNSGFFGQSDNVVFRIEALPSMAPTANGIPGPFHRALDSAQTFPFRVRGRQVQVMRETDAGSKPITNAIVYRLPKGQVKNAQPIANPISGEPFHTDQNGYLQGRGQLDIGDQLVALAPISETQNYVVYHTSATPNETGLTMNTITQPGVQTLIVSEENTLILFNLLVAIEWDARQDPIDNVFVNQLKQDIEQASAILYDATNGQAALGDIHIYQDKGFWSHANIVIQASNNQRPSAVLGGIVLTPTNDMTSTVPITGAYIPGQIRMPPKWNRWGNSQGNLGDDWPRVLAHELGHYLFFVPDNYLGLTEDNRLKLIDCQGLMADPYIYQEFLTAGEIDTDCPDTLNKKYLGRSDWETILTFYPFLTDANQIVGPTTLPLAVTQIDIFEPPQPIKTLAVPFFQLVDQSGSPTSIPFGQGQSYLRKTRSTEVLTDDYMIALGSPIGSWVEAHGAEPQDQICVYDYSQAPLRSGCLEAIGDTATPITLNPVTDWSPQIQVQLVETDTVRITVTNIISEDNLTAQLLPAIGTSSDAVPMIKVNDKFVQTLVAPDGAYYGFIQLSGSNSISLNQARTLIMDYAAIADWGGQGYSFGGQGYSFGVPGNAWSGQSFNWGGQGYSFGGQGYSFGAPLMSSDGQVMIFPLENLFGSQRNFTLQKLSFPPKLDAWLMPVGQAYQFEVEGEVPNGEILFRYLTDNVPKREEFRLRVYFSADQGETWQRLDTLLDELRNHASAQIQGEGIYILASTIEMPPYKVAGCHSLNYRIDQTRSVPEALASIEGAYTTVYDVGEAIRIYDATVSPPLDTIVNKLENLNANETFGLIVTEPVTLYLNIGNDQPSIRNAEPTIVVPPPATYYGWITPTVGFTPTVGMRVTAEVDGVPYGQTQVESLDGRLAYHLQVDLDKRVCGETGRNIVFTIGDWEMDHDRRWDSGQAWYHSLDQVRGHRPPSLNKKAYLPLITK